MSTAPRPRLCGTDARRHLLDVGPVGHQGTDAVQAPGASRLVNGGLALTVLQQQKDTRHQIQQESDVFKEDNGHRPSTSSVLETKHHASQI